jgi:hypothetical protein
VDAPNATPGLLSVETYAPRLTALQARRSPPRRRSRSREPDLGGGPTSFAYTLGFTARQGNAIASDQRADLAPLEPEEAGEQRALQVQLSAPLRDMRKPRAALRDTPALRRGCRVKGCCPAVSGAFGDGDEFDWL